MSSTYLEPAVRSATRTFDRPPTDVDHVVDDALDRPVALVPWPLDAARRGTLAATGELRLLLIDADAPPPVCWDDREDWVRRPARHDELVARARNLLLRDEPAVTVPALDADGILRHGDRWVTIPPIEARILARMLQRPGQVVLRADLVDAGWPDGTQDDRILDSRIKLLRRRLQALGIEVHTVRNVGLLVHVG